jgi:hypothetical protein
MPNDAVTVALLQESMMSRSPVRQLAARIIVDLARARPDLQISHDHMETSRAEARPGAAGKVRAMLYDFCLPASGK